MWLFGAVVTKEDMNEYLKLGYQLVRRAGEVRRYIWKHPGLTEDEICSEFGFLASDCNILISFMRAAKVIELRGDVGLFVVEKPKT